MYTWQLIQLFALLSILYSLSLSLCIVPSVPLIHFVLVVTATHPLHFSHVWPYFRAASVSDADNRVSCLQRVDPTTSFRRRTSSSLRSAAAAARSACGLHGLAVWSRGITFTTTILTIDDKTQETLTAWHQHRHQQHSIRDTSVASVVSSPNGDSLPWRPEETAD